MRKTLDAIVLTYVPTPMYLSIPGLEIVHYTVHERFHGFTVSHLVLFERLTLTLTIS